MVRKRQGWFEVIIGLAFIIGFIVLVAGIIYSWYSQQEYKDVGCTPAAWNNFGLVTL
jgi:hypothetical protein